MASLSNINGLFDVHSTGAILFSDEHGTTGQILRSNGNAAPTWIDFNSTGFGGDYVPIAGNVTITGAIATDTGINFTVGGDLAVTGTSTLTGALSGSSATFTSDAGVIVYTTTSQVGAKITFSDEASSRSQKGFITYRHVDTQSYGSANSFIIDGDQATMTILADGKLMYNEGIYLKPATGTGAGTRKDLNWNTAYNDSITGLAVTGTTTKTLTATQQDGGTLTASWTDNDGGGTVKGTGTATRVAFWSATDTISSSADLYWDNTNNRLGVGLTSPQSPLHVVTSTDLSDALILEFAGTYQGGPYQTFQYNEGGAAPSESGDLIGGIRARAAYAAGTYAGYSTAIEFRNDAAISSTSAPGRIEFYTTSAASVTPVERLRINSSGNAIFTGLVSGITPTAAANFVTKAYADGLTPGAGVFLPLVGGIMTGNTIHNDSVKSIYGTSSDGLEIYHNGSNSYIDDSGTGSLFIRSDDNIYIRSITGNQPFINATKGAGVQLFYNDSQKLETTSTGVSVTGSAIISENVTLSGLQKKIIFNTPYRYIQDARSGADYLTIAQNSFAAGIQLGFDNTIGGGFGATMTIIPSGQTNNAGNVGIGYTAPNAKLHVLGSVILDGYSVSDPDTTSRNAYPADQMFTHYTNNGVSIIGGQGGYTGVGLTIGEETGRSTSFKFIRGVSDTNGGGGAAEEFWVNGVGGSYFAGDMGIGTATPGAKLDVSNKVLIDQDGTYGGGYGVIGFGGKTNGYNRIFGNTGTVDGLFLASATGKGIFFRPNGGTADVMSVYSTGAEIGTGTLSIQTDALLTLNAPNAFAGLDITSQRTSGNIGGLRFTNSSSTLIGLYLVTTVGNHTWYAGGVSLKMTLLANGYLGIGVTNPGYMLDVNEKIRMVGGLKITPTTSTLYSQDGALSYYSTGNGVYLNGAGANGWLRLQASGVENEQNSINIYGSASAKINFRTSNVERLLITSGGTVRAHSRLDVGSTTWTGYASNPVAKVNIEVAGGNALNIFNTSEDNAYLNFIDSQSNGSQYANLAFHSSTNFFTINNMGYITTISNAGSWTFPATITATGDVVAYSDKRLKSNIKTLDGSKVLKMRGVSFEKDGKKGSGVIAQELEKVAPELVHNELEYKGVAYGNLVGYLIEAIKELELRVKELENK